jgi:hypothetical protein
VPRSKAAGVGRKGRLAVSRAAERQAARNVRARATFLAEHELLDAAQVEARSGACMQQELLDRGAVFSVQVGGAPFSAWQFSADGSPLAVIAKALAHVSRPEASDWQLALWFDTRTGWLADEVRPRDLLLSHPDDVVFAAAREAEGFPG